MNLIAKTAPWPSPTRQSQKGKRAEMLFESAFERLLVADAETEKQRSLPKKETYRQTIKPLPKDWPYASKHLTFHNPFN
jgi:hypothetical protein